MCICSFDIALTLDTMGLNCASRLLRFFLYSRSQLALLPFNQPGIQKLFSHSWPQFSNSKFSTADRKYCFLSLLAPSVDVKGGLESRKSYVDFQLCSVYTPGQFAVQGSTVLCFARTQEGTCVKRRPASWKQPFTLDSPLFSLKSRILMLHKNILISPWHRS